MTKESARYGSGKSKTITRGAVPGSFGSSGSNPRASRNMAEKQRRDNLNTNISTMAALVPTVAGSSRKMDKISILRLAAAFLRTQYTLGSGSAGFLPRQFNDFDLEQYFVDNVVGSGGFVIITTTVGKIVYVSRHMEQHLGHAQNEVQGQSLYNFVCPDDHEDLTRNLTPDDEQSSTSEIRSTTASGTSRLSIEENSNSSEDHSSPRHERRFREQKRSFNLRMSQRAVSRREHTQYEYIHMSGVLRLAEACRKQDANSGSRTRLREVNSTSNDIIFVGIARLLKKRTITELSLLEATKDEYVTRHLVDGRIIFCDHRISVVAGYMTEEVSGLNAFKFMHKDDVRWTMIGLRQMYDRGEGFGMSCYRLLSKTGEFIYLRTHGYLEFDKNTQTVESFVCINTLVPEEEGLELVNDMKTRFSASVSNIDNSLVGFKDVTPSFNGQSLPDSRSTLEDPVELEDAITNLISELPSPIISENREIPSPLPHSQYVKAAILSQRLPPSSVQANKIGIKEIHHTSVCVGKEVNRTANDEQVIDCKSPKETSHVVNHLSACEKKLPILNSPSSENNRLHQNVPVAEESIPELDNHREESRIVEQPMSGRRNAPEKKMSGVSKYPLAEKKILSGDRSPAERASPNINLEAGTTSVRCMSPSRRKDLNKVEFTVNSEVSMERPSVVFEARPNNEHTILLANILNPSNSNQEKEEVMFQAKHVKKEICSDMGQGSSTVKRTCKSEGEEPDLVSSKRKRKKSYLIEEETSFGAEASIPDPRSTYYDGNSAIASPIVCFPDEDLQTSLALDVPPMEELHVPIQSPSSSLQDIAMDYQQLDPGTLGISTADEDQLRDFQDIQEDTLSPSLDSNPDLMKMFDNLRPVMAFEKIIDKVKAQQFAVSDQVVNEEIRRTHLQLANSMALRESQFSILERDLEDPALQAQRENFNQLQAEHVKQKQFLKTLQQDHQNMQINVKHNIDV
ncbi:uncharacterized protein LOC107269431 isoform X6 [Cephus cinctus]|uniref:Uncharacterized protein LOC107269431 isoform X6 n=1 Tax=Cephus cinctus TaxID=211228 RepID=A0AAJ7RKC3_CEPCN|nr:uncharacterized protein LOC107269431 isoform X6 [Cephus cinctus]